MFDMSKVTEYVCDKFYYVIYKRYDEEQRAEGLLLNYASGDIVLLSEKGIYHIKHKDIIFMKPFEPPVYRMSEEFKRLLESFDEDNKSPIEKAMYDWAESYFKGASDFMKYFLEYTKVINPISPSEVEDVLVQFCKQFGEVNKLNI